MQKATCTTRDVLQVQEDAKDCKDEEVFSQMPGQLQQPRCNTATTSTATSSSTLLEQMWNLLKSDAADVKEKDHGSLQQLFKRGSSLSLTSDGADVSETDDSGRCESLAPQVMPPLCTMPSLGFFRWRHWCHKRFLGDNVSRSARGATSCFGAMDQHLGRTGNDNVLLADCGGGSGAQCNPGASLWPL